MHSAHISVTFYQYQFIFLHTYVCVCICKRGRKFCMQVDAECYLSGCTGKKVKIIMKCIGIGISLTYPQSTSIKFKCKHHAGAAFQYFVMHLTMLITKK